MNETTPRPRCPRCGGRMFSERHNKDEEWACINCGHVQRPEGFEVLREPDPGNRRRGPRNNRVGMKL